MVIRSIPVNLNDLKGLSPSSLVRRFGAEIVARSKGRPILDIACGGGRNAVLLSHLGGVVICIDRDLSRLESERIRLADTIFAPAFSKIKPLRMDVVSDKWPFEAHSVGGIINVHFLCPSLFSSFAESVRVEGSLLLETVRAHGGNYLELPKAGAVRSAFEKFFALKLYRERKVGPNNHDAVTVEMFGTKFDTNETAV
jgi:SAM-dependent methyltransferase